MILSAEVRQLQASVRRFVDNELIPLEKGLPECANPSRELAEHLQERQRAAGIWAMGVAEDHGGIGAPVLAQIVVAEELSRSLLGLLIAGRNGNPLPILDLATDEQAQRFVLPVVRGDAIGAFALTEPAGGADPVRHLATTARRDGDGWIIDGRKCFVTFGDIADYVVVFASTDPSAGPHGVTAFVIERATPGFEVVRTIPTMGSAEPAELDFVQCRIPDANRIGAVGQGFVLAQRLLGRYRAEIGARAVGASSRLLQLALEYVAGRDSFGKLLVDHQGVQWMLADCAIDIDASRWMTYAAAARCDDGADTRVADSVVKVFTSEALCRVADRVLQLFGGWGYSKDLPIERFYREARMWRIVEGPNEVHRSVVARALASTGVNALDPW